MAEEKYFWDLVVEVIEKMLPKFLKKYSGRLLTLLIFFGVFILILWSIGLENTLAWIVGYFLNVVEYRP